MTFLLIHTLYDVDERERERKKLFLFLFVDSLLPSFLARSLEEDKNGRSQCLCGSARHSDDNETPEERREVFYFPTFIHLEEYKKEVVLLLLLCR